MLRSKCGCRDQQMPIDIETLCRQTEPKKTVLLFGAGSSCPSGGMTGRDLSEYLIKQFSDYKIGSGLTLSEVGTLIETKINRKELIKALQKALKPLKPTGAILNLPLFQWRAIYTTNFDTIIEQSYDKSDAPYNVFRSNFDFSDDLDNQAQRILKIHGCIEQDKALGHSGSIVITENDYEETEEYRQLLYDSLKIELGTSNCIIIGYSLADEDLKNIVNSAIKLKRNSGAPGKITLLLNERNDDRAMLLENKGIEVCFGNIDDFFANLSNKIPENENEKSLKDILQGAPSLRPITIDVAFEASEKQANAIKMFHGRTASYADITKGLTFERDILSQTENFLSEEESFLAFILGAAGVGKSTAARQILIGLRHRGFHCWEHKEDYKLEVSKWLKIAETLKQSNEKGVLFIDDSHAHIREVNNLVEALHGHANRHLKILLCSSKPHWNPRMKSPIIFSEGRSFELSQLSSMEINSLIMLLQRQDEISTLVEKKFLGFSKAEQRRRLKDRCGADMFVCLKNIFSFEKIDDIILREYSELPKPYQEIYRTVAAMEAAGINVHRQLVVRALGIQADSIAQILDNLTDIINEYTINEQQGLYGWRGRHLVIAQILSDYKFSDEEELFELFNKIITHLNPTYRIEMRTLADLCDRKHGLGKIGDKDKQNILLRKMISIAPAERVPRHRLIQNFIAAGDYEQAEIEIRLFENELKCDAPVHRYKVILLLRRAQETKGLMKEDRVSILKKAVKMAEDGISRFSKDKNQYREYFTVGLEYLLMTGDWSIFDNAVEKARDAQRDLLDPDLTSIISKYERKSERLLTGKTAA